MLGHKISSVTEAYFKNDQKLFKTKYMEAVEKLTLDKVKVKKVTTKEYDQIILDLKEKDERIEHMEQEQKQTETKVEKLEEMVTAVLEKQLK